MREDRGLDGGRASVMQEGGERGTTRRRRGAVAESDTIRYRLDAMKTLYAAGSAAILPGNAEVQHEVLADANELLVRHGGSG